MDYVRAKLDKENEPKHPGVIMDYGARGVDDGAGYGDPMIDDRTPDFVKRDNEGWQVLK